VETLLQDPTLGPIERWNTLFAMRRSQERWAEAEECLVLGFQAPAEHKLAFLVERSNFVAEQFPDRVPEALELCQQALQMPIFPIIRSLSLSMEGQLLTLAGQATTGLTVLNLHTAALEASTNKSCSMRPHLAQHRRSLAWALWATGNREKAREMLLLALSTYSSKRWTRLLETDLARLRDGESLFEEPSQAVLEAGRLYVKDYQPRTKWPGNQ
jgi:tetratricopeptide (TPR) repeat protein